MSLLTLFNLRNICIHSHVVILELGTLSDPGGELTLPKFRVFLWTNRRPTGFDPRMMDKKSNPLPKFNPFKSRVPKFNPLQPATKIQPVEI